MISGGQRHSVSVAGVVIDEDGRCLIAQRRDNGHWEPPGGVLEVGETVADGLRREVREETGLEVESVALSGVYKNMRRGVVALVFRCRAVGGKLGATDEARAFRWASREEAIALMDEAYAVRVLDAMGVQSAPAVRAHDGTNLL